MKNFKISKKRNKFNLDDINSDEEGMFMGFTHGGKRLEEFDDFKDQIPLSSDDENEEDQNQKGNLDE